MATKKTWKQQLNQNQIKFCEYYVSEEFFCNWTKSYMKAYPDADYNTARANASDLLTNTSILNYIDSILEDMALNDTRVDKELAKMLIQDEDKMVKIKAMDMYYKITARVEKGLQKAIDKWDVKTDTSLLSKLNKIIW